MAKYMVSYDLRKPEKDYPDLIAYLKKIGGLKVLLSVWLVKSNLDSSVLHNQIATNGKTDSNDRLLVAGLNGAAAWNNLLSSDQAVIDWFDTP